MSLNVIVGHPFSHIRMAVILLCCLSHVFFGEEEEACLTKFSIYPRNVAIMQTVIPISISRVNQFDAARLDIEMSAMLKEQLVKVFSLMKVFAAFLFSIIKGML